MKPRVEQGNGRLIIRFPDTTPQGAAAFIRASGFRWSTKEKGWVRLDSPAAVKKAGLILKKY